jgi:hypothetical protein
MVASGFFNEVPARDAVASLSHRRAANKIDDAMAPMELRTLRLGWVTDDPLAHVDSPYVCFRASAAASTSLPADAVARLLDDDDNIVRITMAKTSPHLVDPATAERIERRYRPGDKFTMWWDDARGHCCVGRSRMAGDWSGDCTPHDLGLRWLPVPS